jgi:CelD/BcsL family acetyltransferase involved in cellulose biosynthesis
MLDAWARHFAGDGRSLITIVVRRDGEAVLVWPLRIERGLVRIASTAGAPVVQYDDILIDPACEPKAALAAALQALRKSIDVDLILLERVRSDSTLRRALGETVPLCADEAAPYADLSRGMKEVLGGQKSSRTVRQQRKRMQKFETGDGNSFAVARDPAEAEAWLAEALALKRDWLKSSGRMSRAFMQAETASCLLDLARTLFSPDASPRAMISKLTVSGRTAAIEVGFVHRGIYHLYLGAFAPEFAKLGPGNIMTQKATEWCVSEGLQRYDMLAPRSRHKSEWQSAEVEVADFALATSMIGKVYAEAILKRVKPALRTSFYRLPAGLRSRIANASLRM